jgi:hypothetical protein
MKHYMSLIHVPCSTLRDDPPDPRPLIRIPSGKGNLFPLSSWAFKSCHIIQYNTINFIENENDDEDSK